MRKRYVQFLAKDQSGKVVDVLGSDGIAHLDARKTLYNSCLEARDKAFRYNESGVGGEFVGMEIRSYSDGGRMFNDFKVEHREVFGDTLTMSADFAKSIWL